MADRAVIQADLTWTGERFERGLRVVVNDGLIETVGKKTPAPTKRLAGRALLPGMVNAHSHAFQRGLRGRGEYFPEGKSDFWAWREEMYSLVDSLDENTFVTLSKQAFTEMLTAGVTAVGEFHYLHHDESCAGFAFDELLLQAASDIGIRMVLLNTFYKTGGISQPLAGPQKRFGTPSHDEYWKQIDRLGRIIDPRLQSIGAAAHSIRAVPAKDLITLHQEAKRRELVFHMHVEEQQKEIELCEAQYGISPVRMVGDRLDLDARFTAVHCTHTKKGDMQRYLHSGANVCICPTTEANLGDGIPDLPHIVDHAGHVSLGTDSNLRISFSEEMRWIEQVQRLARLRRGVCIRDPQSPSGVRAQAGRGPQLQNVANGGAVHRSESGGTRDVGHSESGATRSTATSIFRMATVNGARSLGINCGEIAPGRAADFFTLDLAHPLLAGWTDETLLASFIFGCGNEPIADVCVGGRWKQARPRRKRRTKT